MPGGERSTPTALRRISAVDDRARDPHLHLRAKRTEERFPCPTAARQSIDSLPGQPASHMSYLLSLGSSSDVRRVR
jgi:hypothetical protein